MMLAPTDVSASNTYTDYVLVKWLPVGDAKSYRVYRSASGSFSQDAEMIAEVVYAPPGNSGAHIGLYYVEYKDWTAEIGTRYYYWIKSVGESATSDFSEFAYGVRIPGAVTNVDASDGDFTHGVAVTWDAVEGAEEYSVYRAEATGSYESAWWVGGTERCAFYDTSVEGGTTYRYWVVASSRGTKGMSGDSDTGWSRGVISGKAPYLVIDLSQGPSAERFPCYEMWSRPGMCDWPREYKTEKLVFKRIEPGTFTMGSRASEIGRRSDYWHGDESAHDVTIPNAYYIGIFELTIGQDKKIWDYRETSYSGWDEACPAFYMNYWNARGDLSSSVDWPNSSLVQPLSLMGVLRAKTGIGTIDLPTEAEWEYACRAGTTTAFNNGSNLANASPDSDSDLDMIARYKANGVDSGVAPVGSFEPNDWGLYDMHGNVAEWCLDSYGQSSQTARVLRGGGHADEPRDCRSASRYGFQRKELNVNNGMRVAIRGIVAEVDSGDPVFLIKDGELVACELNGHTDIVLPNTVRSIGADAFRNYYELKNVTIPNTVTNIGESAFMNCEGLRKVSVPDSVAVIDDSAFFGCTGLVEVVIGKGLTTIGEWPTEVDGGYYGKHGKLGSAFGSCSSMIKFAVSSANETFKSVDGMLLTKDGKTLIACPDGKIGVAHVPDGVERIEEVAFDECYGLTSITLPDSLTSIGLNDWRWMSVCDARSIPGVLLIDGWAVGYDYPEPSGELNLQGIRGIGDDAFSGCDELTAVKIPSGVKTIGDYAFCECSMLASVTIPDSVTRIGRMAFKYCNSSLYDEHSVSGAILVDGWAIDCSEEEPEFLDLRGTRGIASEAFAMTGIEEVLLPERLKRIDDGAFACASLTNIVIPSEVAYIGKFGLECPLLESIVFNGNAPEVADSAFSPFNAERSTVYVQRGSTGWNVGIPGTWNGMKIAYVGETPDMIRCNVTFDANGGKPAKQTTEQVATTVWSVDGLQTPTKSGCSFGGWYTAKTGGERVDLDGVCTLSGDTTLYARWLKAYKATAKDGIVYTDESEDIRSSVSALNGTRLYLEAADKSDKNMEFAYWSCSPATVELCDGFDLRYPYLECIMPEANVTFTANYVSKPGYVCVCVYEVNDTDNEDGEPEGIEWSADGKFWLAANDDPFLVKSGKTTLKLRSTDPRWTVPASATCTVENDNTVLDVDIAATRVAVITTDVLLEQSEASGTVTMNPTNGQVLPGKPVTLTAKAGKDSVFAYWMVGCEKVGYTATFKYAPDADCTVTAVFRLKSTVADPALDVDAVVPSANATVGVAFEASVPLDYAAYPAKFSAKGLPAGLKIDAASGMISGVPTKAGDYAVTVTAAGGANGKAKSSMTLPITIKPLPEWAQGTFTGRATAYVEGEDDEDVPADSGLATVTVSAAGKVSGKVSLCGTNWTFSATSYDAASTTGAADEDLDGAEEFVIAAEMKSGKIVKPLRLTVTRAEPPQDDGEVLQNASVWGWTTSGMESFELCRTMWKDKSTAAASKAVLAAWEGVYTLSLGSAEDYGSGYLSLTVGKDGNVKATGKLADGTGVSATSPLMYDADFGYFAYLYAAPSAYKGGCLALAVGFDAAGARREQTRSFTNDLRDARPYQLAPVMFEPQWTSRNPQATDEYGEGFDRILEFSGAYYDKLNKLSEYYEQMRLSLSGAPMLSYTYKSTYLDDDTGRKVTESWLEEAEAADTLNQDGLTVAVDEKGKIVVTKATKPVQDRETKEWYYEGTNDGALALSFTQATGIFKGAYTFWYDYTSAYDDTKDKETMAHTSKKVNFEGIMVQGEAGLRGFYLWDATAVYEDDKTGKEKTYKYKESYSVELK